MSSLTTDTTRPSVRLPRGLSMAADGIRFTNPITAAAQPPLWLEAFRAAIANGRAVSQDACAVIHENVEQFTAEQLAATAADRAAILDLLVPRPGFLARLTEMADCGLLQRLFPELNDIHLRAVRDSLRRFSACGHALLPIRPIESLRNPATPGRARFTAILEVLRTPELLTLALLLHDVGRRRPHGDPREILRLAQPAIERLQLPASAAEMVRFLIRHHRRMARVALRRDAGSPEVVNALATLVGSEELLKMLCLLTVADLEAVSPDVLTPWKEDRLWRLYMDAGARLAVGKAIDSAQMDQAALAVAMAGRPEDISEAELQRFIGSLPAAYPSVFGLATMYGHVRLARGILAHEVHASLEQSGAICELTVVTMDKPFLFSNIAGLLSYFGMDIHSGQAMTTPEGLVLAVFEFTDAEGFLAQNRGANRKLQRMLEAVVAGSVDVSEVLRGRVESEHAGAPPSVTLDNTQSEHYTVLEITADDAPGLLFRISRVVAQAGCAVGLALVATEQGKAIDALHVTRDGKKLSDVEQQELRESLEAALSRRGARAA